MVFEWTNGLSASEEGGQGDEDVVCAEGEVAEAVTAEVAEAENEAEAAEAGDAEAEAPVEAEAGAPPGEEVQRPGVENELTEGELGRPLKALPVSASPDVPVDGPPESPESEAALPETNEETQAAAKHL